MNRFTHGLWAVALVLVALLTFGWQQRRVGAANERARVTQDSLRSVGLALKAASDSALAIQRRAQVEESQRLARLRAAQIAQGQAQKRADSLWKVLESGPGDTLSGVLMALRASWRDSEALLAAQRDSALALFYGARASRDTLASLLAASQRQNAALEAALVRASKRGFTEGPVFRWGSLALAYIAGRKL
jgi:hypothetical protein